jgi:hypothetical protein
MNQIVPATLEHVEELCNRVRGADLIEMEAALLMDTKTALLMSYCLSTECYAWMCNGQVAAVFGVAPDADAEGVGCPWMIGSELVAKENKWFLRNSRRVINDFNKRFPLLENYVHPDNSLSIRWLEWCGFKFCEPEPYGAKGELFIPFFKEL